MADWTSLATDILWRNGLTAIPIVGSTALAAKFLPCRPATRHMMWLTVLAWFVIPPFLPEPPTPQLASYIEKHVALSAPATPTKEEAAIVLENDPTRAVRALIELSRALSGEGTPVEATPRGDRIAAASPRPESTPPSPRLVARPADREPDLLAQASDAGGPLSVLPTTREFNKSERRHESAGKFEVPSSKFKAERRSHGATEPSFEWRMANGEDRIERVNSLNRDEASDLFVWEEDEAGVITVEFSPPFAPVAEAGSVDLVLATTSASVAAAGYLWAQVVESMHGRAWTVSLRNIRDDVMALPPIPVPVWISGIALIALVSLFRILQFRRYFASATPPTREVLRTVVSASRELGLPRAPRTLMIDGRVSPMIWCGLRPTLLIPAPLWEQLDEPGRRAVLFHELAHVRRRDYVVHWIESVIGIVYWWHPLVWWVRRSLHAEAEVCCDAWVTTLMPRTRRAYAEALLLTQQYVDSTDRPTPSLGIGVTTGRARRFARRLTMVMTETTKPRLSFSGFAMVLSMATIGWLASPASSCPDDEKKDSPRASATHKCCDKPGDCKCAKSGDPAAPCAKSGAVAATPCAKAVGLTTTGVTGVGSVTVGTPAIAPVAARNVVALTGTPTIVTTPIPAIAMAGGPKRDKDEDDDDGDDERVNRLEERMERLNEKLDRMMDAIGNRHEGHDDGGPTPPGAPREPRTPRAPRAARAPEAPDAPTTPAPPMMRVGPLGAGPGAVFAPDGGPVGARTYRLPKGKLEAMTALMSRSDVPILVRATGEALEVQATPGQHHIFGAFVRMIDPGNDSVSQGPGRGEHDHAIAGDLHRKVEQEMKARAEGGNREIRERTRELEKEAKQRAKEMEKRERKRSKVGSRMDQMRSEYAARMERHETLARESEQLKEQAENLAEEADDIREKNNDLSSRAGREREREARMELEREALNLRHRAEALDQQREQLENQAREIEDSANDAEGHAREAEERMRELEEELGQLDNEASEGPDEDDESAHASADEFDNAAVWQMIPIDGNGDDHDDDEEADDDDDDESDSDEDEATAELEAALQSADDE